MSAAADRLPFRTKLAYGTGELGPSMAGGLLVLLQLKFLTDVAGLPPERAGLVLLVGKIWDAINDPLVGWLSDRTRSRFGRRIVWILYAAVPFAILQFAMWYVPGGGQASESFLFWYYVAATVGFNMFYTMVSLPHASLTAELSLDYDERTSIASFRQAFALGGVLAGNILSFLVFHFLSEHPPTLQYAVIAAVVSVLILIGLAVCLAGIWQRVVQREPTLHPDRATDEPALSLREQAAAVLANGPYLCVCAIYLFSWLAMQFTANILPFYVESWLGLPPASFAIIALIVFSVAVLTLPLFAWIAHAKGKRAAYILGMVIWIAAQAGLYFLPQGHSPAIYLLCVMAGFGVCVTYLIPNAMVPDTIELDELRTGRRREGVYYGLFVFLQKMALAIGSAVLGWVLSQAGYVSGAAVQGIAQPETALTAIRIAIGPLPAAALLIGLVFAWLYPIDRARHAAILEELTLRREKRNQPPPPGV